MGELLSTMRSPSGRLPGGSSSSPVTTSRTRGCRTQRTGETPIEASRPTSWGRRRRPAWSTTVPPAVMSSADGTHVLARRDGVRSATRSPCSSAISAIATASAPSGRGAPVMIRTAWPGRPDPRKGRPG